MATTLVHEKFLAILKQAREENKDEEPEDMEDLYHGRGRSDVILTRGGRTWFIEMDTCHGHSEERLAIVPGKERMTEEESESESEEEEEKFDGKALFKSSVNKARLMNLAGLLVTAPPKVAEVKVSMVPLIEEDDDPDPALNIPMFAPLRAGPAPQVEIDEGEAKEQQRVRQQKRGSAFLMGPPGGTLSKSLASGAGIDADAIALVASQSEDEDDEDDDELLEGFGTRPEKKTVHVRKFVRRNKFFKKVFKRGSNSNVGNIHIEDDHYE